MHNALTYLRYFQIPYFYYTYVPNYVINLCSLRKLSWSFKDDHPIAVYNGKNNHKIDVLGQVKKKLDIEKYT